MFQLNVMDIILHSNRTLPQIQVNALEYLVQLQVVCFWRIMARLLQHVTNIGEPTLKLLKQNNILTVLDFLEEDPDRMCNVSGLSFKTVIEIRRSITSKFAVKPKTGFEMYNNMVLRAAKLSTGIESLDKILEGGILTGNICEICGLSGEGKTQLCFSIATHCSHNLKHTVYYVDAKHDFSGHRIRSILEGQHCNDEEIKTSMEKIKVTKINDMYQLITFLHELERLFEHNPSRLVIIDSLPVLFTPFIGSSSHEGFKLLTHVAQVMKNISAKYQIVFLIVNLVMLPFEVEDCEAHPSRSSTSVGDEINFMGELKPGLGKSWSHTPSYRLLIQKHDSLHPKQRMITLVKSTDIESGSKCVVEITNSGIVSLR